MQILLYNFNFAGEMKLMIDDDGLKTSKREAAIKAANTMNTLQQILISTSTLERELGPVDYEELANLYGTLRTELKTLFDSPPLKEQEKYFGLLCGSYHTEYEKKIAEGVYNPDDGIIKQFTMK